MDTKNRIFLSPAEALRAIRIDFKQYGPQFHLFQSLCPILTHNRTIVTKNEKGECILMKRGKKSKTRRISEQKLGDYLFKILNENDYPLPIIAEICQLVFETRVGPGKHPISGRDGIWIETDMASFQCCQCGDCCRTLFYHNDCTAEDYQQWETLGRTDIMEKVMVIQSEAGETQYRIWMDPETRRLYSQCPWIVLSPLKNKYDCLIQDVKPEICRQYPYTRKHAIMTGCKGKFED
jgi:Fe-S-cluster containining protein